MVIFFILFSLTACITSYSGLQAAAAPRGIDTNLVRKFKACMPMVQKHTDDPDYFVLLTSNKPFSNTVKAAYHCIMDVEPSKDTPFLRKELLDTFAIRIDLTHGTPTAKLLTRAFKFLMALANKIDPGIFWGAPAASITIEADDAYDYLADTGSTPESTTSSGASKARRRADEVEKAEAAADEALDKRVRVVRFAGVGGSAFRRGNISHA